MVNFNQIDWDYYVSWQTDLENTKESIFPDCDKSCHMIKENMPIGEEHENWWNYSLLSKQYRYFKQNSHANNIWNNIIFIDAQNINVSISGNVLVIFLQF